MERKWAMKNIITAKKTTVTDGIRAHIERRFAKFDKYVEKDITVHTKIEVKDNGNRHKVEVTIPFGKQILRAESNGSDMYAAIDDVEKTMSRLLKKRKEKLTQRRQQPAVITVDAEEIEQTYAITRVKHHTLLSMTAQEACEAMEMVGHPFYVYNDIDANAVCAVYVREDGNYGHLIYN
jgi:ribosomal subunit interface protein